MADRPQQQTRETVQEREARIFPYAIGLNRKRQDSGGEDPADDDVQALVEAWRDPMHRHRFEVEASARQILVDKWPGQKMREGRAKWDDYEELSLWGKDWKEIGTRAYSVELPDGSWGHRCLFEMYEKQRRQARATLVKQKSEINASVRDMDKFERQLALFKVPKRKSPSDFFTARRAAA